MPEKTISDQIQRTLAGLAREVILFDENGTSIPAGSELAPPEWQGDEALLVEGGVSWVRVFAPPIAFAATIGTGSDAADCLRLVAALAESSSAEPQANDRDGVYRLALREELSAPELETLAAEHRIPMTMERCAILIHGAQASIADLIEVGEEDVLIEMDRHALVLVKSMHDMEGYDDLVQLAEAIEQTIASETGETPTIGVGECRQTLGELGASYRAAWRALEIGRLYKPDQDVYAFGHLVLERYLSEIPKEICSRYHHLLFNRKTQRLFNEEMLHTIEMFFAKDLNLSDTARQLYIHRNTLVYRLDKIQRQTGLDLRRFEDAITFQTLLLLGKNETEKPPQVR